MRPRDDGFSLNVSDVIVLERDSKVFVGPLRLFIAEHLATKANVEQLDKILSRYPGQTEVIPVITSGGQETEYKIKHKVFVSESLISEIKQYFGVSVLGSAKQIDLAQPFTGDDVTPLVVEQAGQLFGE